GQVATPDTSVSMDTPEPGPADGEERMVELRPRTRSNPEGAEDRRGSTGSLGGNSNGSIPHSNASQPPMSASIPPPAEYQLRVPRVNCPEKVIICLDLSEEMSLPKLESFNGRQKIELPMTENVQTIPPPYVIRTVLIYSRQAGPLQFNPSEAVSKMLQSPYFFFDVVYLHNGMDEQGDETSWRENYTSFCNLDSKGMCYRYEVSLCGPAIELHNCMAKLLSHPLQRPFQSHASYSLLEGEEPQDVEATV
uniref:BRISC and BRCA1-A complex member 1 n=1 Tax=Periophthalmus magnuspinnatus TaxID=409849 RepID=A0A3B4ALL7_9GOBI